MSYTARPLGSDHSTGMAGGSSVHYSASAAVVDARALPRTRTSEGVPYTSRSNSGGRTGGSGSFQRPQSEAPYWRAPVGEQEYEGMGNTSIGPQDGIYDAEPPVVGSHKEGDEDAVAEQCRLRILDRHNSALESVGNLHNMADHMQREAQATQQRTGDDLREYEQHVTESQQRRAMRAGASGDREGDPFDWAKFLSEMNLLVSMEDLVELNSYETPNIGKLSKTLQEARSPPGQEEDPQALRRAVEMQLRNCSDMYSQDLVSRTVLPLMEMMDTPLQINLRTQEALKHVSTDDQGHPLTDEDFKGRILSLDSHKQHHLEEEEMHKAELAMDDLISVSGSWVESVRARISVLATHEVSGAAELNTQLDQFEQSTRDELEDFKETQHSLLEQLDRDVITLRENQQVREEESKAADVEFRDNRQRNELEMERNSAEQARCITQIKDLFTNLSQLEEERANLVMQRMTQIRNDQERRAKHTQALQQMQVHMKVVQSSVEYVQRCLDVMSPLENFVSECSEQVRSQVQDVMVHFRDSRTRENQNYLQAFRAHYLSIGELMFKKESRASQVQNLIGEKEMQHRIARDTLDPQSKMLREQVRLLQEEYDSIQHKIQALHQRADFAKEQFSPCSEDLQKSGVQFTHPALELMELNRQRTERLQSLQTPMAGRSTPSAHPLPSASATPTQHHSYAGGGGGGGNGNPEQGGGGEAQAPHDYRPAPTTRSGGGAARGGEFET